MNDFKQVLRDNREQLTLVGYFALILVLAWPIADMLATAWETTFSDRGLSNAAIRLVRFGILASLIDSSHQTLTGIVFGVYIGLLILMTVDPKKRWQAFLLWVGTIAGLIALQSVGLVLPQLSLTDQGPAIILGVVLGLLIGGGRKLLDLRRGQVLEFRRASQALFVLLTGFVIIGLIELHFQYPGLYVPSDSPVRIEFVEQELMLISDGLVYNLVVSGIFIATLKRFVQYDANKDFFILGPPGSGKSLFLIGTYLEALERSERDESNSPLRPSQDLMSLLESLDRRESDWILGATGRGDIEYLGFQYVHGSVFPTNIQVSAIDYAGEYLTLLPDAITGAIEEDEMDNALRRLVDGVETSDTLLLVIDVERFENNQSLDIAEYFSILQASDDKDVILIATKADVLAEQFKSDRGVEAHRYFDEFTEYVNTRLQQSENVNSLVSETGGREIHPVYYQTKKDEDGNRIPMRDQHGSVMTVGFDELLEKMGRI